MFPTKCWGQNDLANLEKTFCFEWKLNFVIAFAMKVLIFKRCLKSRSLREVCFGGPNIVDFCMVDFYRIKSTRYYPSKIDQYYPPTRRRRAGPGPAQGRARADPNHANIDHIWTTEWCLAFYSRLCHIITCYRILSLYAIACVYFVNLKRLSLFALFASKFARMFSHICMTGSWCSKTLGSKSLSHVPCCWKRAPRKEIQALPPRRSASQSGGDMHD